MDIIEQTTKKVHERLKMNPNDLAPVTEWLIRIVIKEYNKIVEGGTK